MIQPNNFCPWLKIGYTLPCNKNCVNEFCSYHMQCVRNGSLGPKPCIRCGVGVRGKTHLCAQCGGKRYRELKRYYDKKYNIDSIIKREEDYLARFSKQ